MTWALGLGRGPAKRPLAIVALSGFMPRVEGLEIDVSDLDGYPGGDRPRHARPR